MFASWVGAERADGKEHGVTRKRYPWSRSRDRRRRRPRTPAPTTGWVVSEFAALTQLSPRTIRYYRVVKLLPALSFRGTSTRYQRVHLLRVLALQRLKAENVPLAAIRQRLEAMSEAELVAFVSEGGVTEAVARALGLPSPANAAVAPSESRVEPPRQVEAVAAESWHRVHLVPGLELHVSGDAGPLAHRLVMEICAECMGDRRAVLQSR